MFRLFAFLALFCLVIGVGSGEMACASDAGEEIVFTANDALDSDNDADSDACCDHICCASHFVAIGGAKIAALPPSKDVSCGLDACAMTLAEAPPGSELRPPIA